MTKPARILALTVLGLGACLMASAASQSITFDAIPNQIFGVSPFPISAQATSGLPVSFTSNIPAVCTSYGGLVMLLSVGTCPITATQSGNANLDAASATRTFSVIQAGKSGGFAASPSGPFATGHVPVSIAVGDFNGDGILDAVVADGFSTNLAVLLGDGSGGFAEASGSPITMPAHPLWVVTGDFNMDGIPDIAVTLYGSTNLMVMLGNGLGGFTPAPGSPFAAGGNPFAVVVGDFNGDGLQDLATANPTNGSLSILLGNGSGGFTLATGGPVPVGSSPYVLAVGDFNGDGNQDLAAATEGYGTVVLLGNGAGGFTAVAGSPFAPVAEVPTSIVVGDFNGDGIQDLAVANFYEKTVTVLTGTGSGGFIVPTGSPFAAGLYPESLAAGDFNGDGIQDLAVSDQGSNSVALYLGSGSGGFAISPGSPFATGNAPYYVMAADFNRDGILDLIVANYNDSDVTVLLGVATGNKPQTITFGSLSGVTYGIAPFAVTATSDSGLTVSFASATAANCTIAGNTVTIIFAGTCTIIASQAGDSTYATAASVSQSFTVSLASQTITFGPLSDQIFGTSPPPLSATATSGQPVQFISNSTSVCTVSGVTITLVSAGTCSITALSYGSGGTYNAAPTITRTFAVSVPPISMKPNSVAAFSAATAVTITGSSFGAGATVVFTPPGGSATGITPSAIQSTTITATIPAALLTLAGTAKIAVSYGQGAVTGQVSFTITAATVTTLTSSVNPAIHTQPILLTASVLPKTATGTVTFNDGQTTIGTATLSGGTAQLSISTLTVGQHSVTASYGGDANDPASSSASLSQTVFLINNILALTSSANPSVPSQSVTLFATLTSAYATGTVTFKDGPTILGTGALQNGIATLTVPGFAAGTHSLTASYGGDGLNAAVTSPAMSEVTDSPTTTTTTTLASSQNPSKFGQTVTLTATLSPVAAAGNVTFYDGSTVLGTSAVSAGAATLTTELLAAGAHSLKAYFAFGDTYMASTSSPLAQIVGATPVAAGGFYARATYSVGNLFGGSGQGVVAGDFNGDNIADLAVNLDSSSISIYPGVGDGTFGTPVEYAAGTIPFTMVAGDFNGDGKTDLAAASYYGVTVLLGIGDGTFRTAVTYPVSGTPQRIATGDFNQDGKTDLVVVGDGVSILPGNGDGTFGHAVTYFSGDSLSAVAVGDFNSDGKPDLVVTGLVKGASILAGNGDGTFQAGSSITGGAVPNSVAVGDFNGDGNADLALTDAVTGSVDVLLGKGDGTFQTAVSYLVGGTPTTVIAGDVNGDGNVDLVTAIYGGSNLSVLPGKGDGSFGSPIHYATGNSPVYTALGDFNGDGAMDIAVTGLGSTPDVSILLGVTGTTAQTVAFGALSNVAVGTLPFTVSATAASGLAVSFTSTTPTVCTVSGSSVTVLAAGGCSITATQAGNSTYAPATTTQSFTVTPPIYQLTAAVSPSNSGTITISPVSTGNNYASGSTVCLSASPAAGQIFTGWTGTALNAAGCLTITASASVTANFLANPISASSALRFVPAAPCRLVDTRSPDGPLGGPAISGGSARSFTIPGACNIPSTALAYSLNLTVIPHGTLGYVTLWPTGQTQPVVSTLNSLDGRIKSNAAVVPAGTGGAVSVFATDTTDAILDINGYFDSYTDTSALQFYPLTPCRVADTRNSTGSLGGPSLLASQARSFPVMSSACNIPVNALAYSLNFTAIPQGPLGYLTVWPNGQSQPVVSTLNAPTGAITANAAIVPAGTGGAIELFATDNSDMAIDINGYFAAPASGGLSLYNLTPCRIEDTRNPSGTPVFTGTVTETATGVACGVPPEAQSLVLNATVVPSGELGYLSLWANGGSQPVVSTLNSLDGSVTSNMAVVPTTNGLVNAYAAGPGSTYVILDISGYFAP